MKIYGQQPAIPLLDPKFRIRSLTDTETAGTGPSDRISITSMMDTYRQTRAISADQNDKGRTESPVKVGSFVAVPSGLANIAVTKFDDHRSHKSRAIYVGPFKVTRKLDGDNFIVNMSDGSLTTFHVSQLKPLPEEAGQVEPEFGQPAALLWPNGKPKVRFIDRSRSRKGGPQYLAHFWGQHYDHGHWVAKADIEKADMDKINAFHAREKQGTPSIPRGKLILDATRAPSFPFRRSDTNE
jgi:hypothetical protein